MLSQSLELSSGEGMNLIDIRISEVLQTLGTPFKFLKWRTGEPRKTQEMNCAASRHPHSTGFDCFL